MFDDQGHVGQRLLSHVEKFRGRKHFRLYMHVTKRDKDMVG